MGLGERDKNISDIVNTIMTGAAILFNVNTYPLPQTDAAKGK